MDRGGEIRGRTAIDAPTGNRLVRHLLKGRAGGALHGVVNLDIVRPAAEMVVIKLSSHPVAGAAFTHPLTLKAWAALAQAVRR